MIRRVALLPALLLGITLASCGSAGEPTAGRPSPTGTPNLTDGTDVPGPGPTTTTTATAASQPMAPLPAGCDLVTAADIARETGVSGFTKNEQSTPDKSSVGCTYTNLAPANPARSFGVVVAGEDFDVSLGTTSHVIESLLLTGGGTRQHVPGVGDDAEIDVSGTGLTLGAVTTVGSHYRCVKLDIVVTSGGDPARWRHVLIALGTSAMHRML